MPNRDGTGPLGQGPGTGRGLGRCRGGARRNGPGVGQGGPPRGGGRGRCFGGGRGRGYGAGSQAALVQETSGEKEQG